MTISAKKQSARHIVIAGFLAGAAMVAVGLLAPYLPLPFSSVDAGYEATAIAPSEWLTIAGIITSIATTMFSLMSQRQLSARRWGGRGGRR
jgi:hypothetical protein